MIAHVIARVQAAHCIEQVILATTDHTSDDELATVATGFGVKVFRGSENDVLDRYYQAAKTYNASVIVRVTGDCPVIDPHIIDQTVGLFQSWQYDYVNNFMQRTFPDGLDTEVIRFSALERAWQDATLQSEREHVTPYLYKNPQLFAQGGLTQPYDRGEWRWTVDEPVDFDFIEHVYSALYDQNPLFGQAMIVDLLTKNPDLRRINQGIGVNEGYEKSLQDDMLRSSSDDQSGV